MPMTSIGAGAGSAEEADLYLSFRPLPKISSILSLLRAAVAGWELSAASVVMTYVDRVTPSTLLCIPSPFLLSFRTIDTEPCTSYHLLLFPSPVVTVRNVVVVAAAVVPLLY